MIAEGPPLTIRQVRAIAAVADRESLAQASASLAMSQSSLSRQIAAAERTLGLRLFQRGWTGMEPTVSGATVVAHCRRMMGAVAEAQRSLEAGGGKVADLGHHLTWPMLSAIDAVRSTGGASAAAAYLQVSQPDVSRLLAKANTAIGHVAFVRGRAGLTPTDAVPVLCELRARLLSEALALPAVLSTFAGDAEDRVAVGLLPFSEQDAVVRAFGALLDRHRHVRLQAVTGSYAALVDALRRSELDLVLGPLRDPAPFPDLEEVHLHDEELVVVASRDHPLARRPASLGELAQESWVAGPHGTPTRRYLDDLFVSDAVPPPARICEMVTFSLAEQMVLDSGGVGLLTYSARKRMELRAGLAVVAAPLPAGARKIGLTRRRHRTLTPLQTEFIDLLVADLPTPC